MEYIIIRDEDYLAHYGIKGQKHGIRRYQNEDGSLTPEGKERYGEQRGWEARQMYKRGTITKDEYKQRKRSDSKLGAAADTYLTGETRASREFAQRHSKGINAAGTILGAIGGAMTAARFTTTYGESGKTVAAKLLAGAAVGAGVGYGSGKLSGFVNDAILENVYNKNSKR